MCLPFSTFFGLDRRDWGFFLFISAIPIVVAWVVYRANKRNKIVSIENGFLIVEDGPKSIRLTKDQIVKYEEFGSQMVITLREETIFGKEIEFSQIATFGEDGAPEHLDRFLS